MNFKQAFEALKQGVKVKLPGWAGFWSWENNTIKMHCKNGDVLDIRETQDLSYTLENILREDWEVIGDVDIKDLNIQTFTFGEAIRRLKSGQCVSRKGWNGRGMFIVYREEHRALGNFLHNPYLLIKNVDGSLSTWVPSINDCLAADWIEVKNERD